MEFPRINSIIAFLEKYSPDELEKLRKQFPNQKELLSSDFALGKKEDDALEPRKATMLINVNSLKENSDKVHYFLKDKLIKSKKYRFFFNLLTILTSATVLGMIISDTGLYAKISAVVGLTLNIIALIIEQFDTGFLLGEEKNPSKIFQDVSNIKQKAFSLEFDIKLLELEGLKKDDLISITNIAKELTENLNRIIDTNNIPIKEIILKS